MGPLITRVRLVRFGLVIGAWTLYGLLGAWQSHYWYAFTKTPMAWTECLRFELTYAWLWAFCTPVILQAARRFRYERGRRLVSLSIHLVLMTLVVCATRASYEFITSPPRSMFYRFTWEKAFRAIESNFDTGVLLYAVVVLIEHAIVFQQRHHAGLVRASALQTQLIQAQMQALKMQLHPHFLFNALHTITVLVHEDPERAEQTIARLGELLRLFLATSSLQEAPLREELRILDLYLDIERARFEERLLVSYNVPDSLLDATVPNLILQPLVENSVRHGVGRIAEPGSIVVAAERSQDSLMLTVTDNGEGLKNEEPAKGHSGMGLAITRGRLATLYGSNQSFTLRNVQPRGTEARITLPLRIRDRVYSEQESCVTGTVDYVRL